MSIEFMSLSEAKDLYHSQNANCWKLHLRSQGDGLQISFADLADTKERESLPPEFADFLPVFSKNSAEDLPVYVSKEKQDVRAG